MAVRKGWVIAILLVFFVAGLGLVSVGLLLSEKKIDVKEGTTLVLDLSEDLVEDPPTDARSQIFYRETPTLWDFLRALDHAAQDERIEAVLLRIEGGGPDGWAKLEELREKLLFVQEQGKQLVAYIEGGEDKDYVLATAADAVYMAPNTNLFLDGLAAYAVFLKGTLDKLGVEADLEHVGEYKSAAEPLTQTSMSDAAREAANAVLDATFADMVRMIGEGRGVDSAAVVSLIDGGPYSSKEALAAGLVDSLLYPDQLEAVLPGGEDGPRIELEDYLSTLPRSEGPATGPRIAVVHATGTIVAGESGTDPLWGRTVGSETFIEALEDAQDERGVEAIVVRVDSPGGEIYASHLMWHAIRQAARELPVVASFSDYAASGGYYIAMGADTVIADRGTLTGSIGVLGGKFNVSGLYEKLGMNVETLTRGENALFLSPFRSFTPAEREQYTTQMFDEYRTFVGIVAENRGRSADAIDSLARGRVWTGAQARERDLVDEVGGLEHAIAVAKVMAGLEADTRARIVIFPRVERSFLQQIVSRLVNEEELSQRSTAWRGWVGNPLELLGGFARLARSPVLALMPYRLELR